MRLALYILLLPLRVFWLCFCQLMLGLHCFWGTDQMGGGGYWDWRDELKATFKALSKIEDGDSK